MKLTKKKEFMRTCKKCNKLVQTRFRQMKVCNDCRLTNDRREKMMEEICQNCWFMKKEHKLGGRCKEFIPKKRYGKKKNG